MTRIGKKEITGIPFKKFESRSQQLELLDGF
jgi:hypothetical protein